MQQDRLNRRPMLKPVHWQIERIGADLGADECDQRDHQKRRVSQQPVARTTLKSIRHFHALYIGALFKIAESRFQSGSSSARRDGGWTVTDGAPARPQDVQVDLARISTRRVAPPPCRFISSVAEIFPEWQHAGQISSTVDPAISLSRNVDDIITRFGGDGSVSLRRGFGDDIGWFSLEQ